jgi:hypothetical protein
VYTNTTAAPFTSNVASWTVPFIFRLFEATVILFVPAVFVESKIRISSPFDGDAGKVNALAADVSTK